jgi:hypothetical protein
VAVIAQEFCAAAAPEGPYEENFDSIEANYKTPQWFTEGKFGIFRCVGLSASG